MWRGDIIEKQFFTYWRFSNISQVQINRRPLQHLERTASEHILAMCLFCLNYAARERPELEDVPWATTSAPRTVNTLGSGAVGWRAVFILRTDSSSATWLPLPLWACKWLYKIWGRGITLKILGFFPEVFATHTLLTIENTQFTPFLYFPLINSFFLKSSLHAE